MAQEQTAITLPQVRPVPRAMWRGLRLRCPACGGRHLFTGFLKVVERCPNCGEDLSHQRADDAPPYFTIFIVAHIVVPLMWLGEKMFAPPIGAQIAVWLPIIAGLTLWLLPRVKGSIVGLQWAMRMHGFGGPEAAPQDKHSHWEQQHKPQP